MLKKTLKKYIKLRRQDFNKQVVIDEGRSMNRTLHLLVLNMLKCSPRKNPIHKIIAKETLHIVSLQKRSHEG